MTNHRQQQIQLQPDTYNHNDCHRFLASFRYYEDVKSILINIISF